MASNNLLPAAGLESLSSAIIAAILAALRIVRRAAQTNGKVTNT